MFSGTGNEWDRNVRKIQKLWRKSEKGEPSRKEILIKLNEKSILEKFIDFLKNVLHG